MIKYSSPFLVGEEAVGMIIFVPSWYHDVEHWRRLKMSYSVVTCVNKERIDYRSIHGRSVWSLYKVGNERASIELYTKKEFREMFP